MPFQYRLFVSPSSLTHWIVIASAVISASINMSVLLEFVCFQVPIKFAGCSAMCEWLLTHCEVAGVLGWWCGCGIGCFLRLLSFGNIRCAAMCEWWLAHCGVVGRFARLCVSGGWHIAGEAGRVVGWSVMCGRFCGACDSRCGCEPVLHNNAALVGNDGRGSVSAAMWPQLLDGVADPNRC